MLDIHTHLYFDAFDADREDVIRRARAVGVKQMIVVACHQDDFGEATRLAERYEDMYASIGVHPNEFRKDAAGDWLSEMREYLTHEKVVAVGECGLDFYLGHGAVDETIQERQIQAFRAQLALAEEHKLPVIVHCRDAYQALLEVLRDFPELTIVLHCYMGDTQMTRQFLQLPNIYFSFTGNITYPVKKEQQETKDDLTETVKLIPKERLFVETDCPFLAPQVKRGERNEPSFVGETAKKAAELLGISLEALEDQLE
jgi:TatD DNase family protein